MENLLQVILLWYFLPLVISFSVSYICIKRDLKTNKKSDLEVLFGFSFIPFINILTILVLLCIFIIRLSEEFGKYLVKSIIKK